MSPPVSPANQICMPNPCKNGGRCIPIGSTQSTCNCDVTGYRGTFCDVGFVVTPEYPRLNVKQSVTLTFKFSPAKDNVTFMLQSDGVKFDPKKVAVSYDKNSPSKLYEVNITITAVSPGVHDVKYEFSGPGSNVYEAVLPDVIMVNDSRIECGPNAGVFPPTCNRLNLKFCPRTGDIIFAQSSSSWDVTSTSYTTKGATVLSSSNIEVPLALRGISLSRTINPSSIPFKVSFLLFQQTVASLPGWGLDASSVLERIWLDNRPISIY